MIGFRPAQPRPGGIGVVLIPGSGVRRAAFVLLALLAIASGRAEILWQIGQPDESSSEFSHWRNPGSGTPRLNYADPSQNPVFRVGRDDPARHWFAYQPGTANGAAGFREHPFTVEFELQQPPSADAVLTLHLLAYSVRLPRVEVDINGERGWYHQEPRLTYTAGDPAAFYLPHYSRAVIRVPIPRERLRQGLNRLVLTPVDSTGERDDGQPSGFTWPGVSGLVYDALSLESATGKSADDVSVRVDPTLFYARTGGRLTEDVDLTVALERWSSDAAVDLSVGGFRWNSVLPAGRSHGEARWRIPVPEFADGTEARVRITSAGLDRTFVLPLKPARRWTLLLVPNQHLDIGYTDHPAKISELQSRGLDRALELAKIQPGFRYTMDGSWVLQEYLRGRTGDRDTAVLRAIRRGVIEVPAVYASHFTGFASLENLVRSLYPARRLSRDHGLPFDLALSTDVPSHSWSWASVLNAAGVRFFVAASDAYRAPFLLENRLHEASPFRWSGPDGGSVWTWYSRHYHQGASLLGAPPRMESAMESLPRFLQAYEHTDYRPEAVILYGTQVENVALDPEQASFADRWNRRFAYPRLEYSTFAEAMRAVTRDSGADPRVVRGDGGPYWEDGLAAHARITALARGTMRRARSAEIFSTVATELVRGFEPDPGVVDRLWESLLVTDEHTWHADVSVSDPDSLQSVRQGELRDSRTTDAARAADHLLARALAAITERIPNPNRTLVVFNSLSWTRDGWVEVDVPKGMYPVDLETGEPAPFERIRSGNAFQRLRFLARRVPSVGYRSYPLRPLPRPPAASEPEESTVLETPHHRIVLQPTSGSLASWTDRASGREWIESGAAWGFNQHLYVTGADALPNRLVQYSTVSPEPSLTVHPAAGGRRAEVVRHPWGLVARMECTNLHHPRIETILVLRNDDPTVEIVNRLEKVAVRTKEAAYFAFPFRMEAPQFRYATQNGFVDPARDLLPGACREWFCIQDWLSLDQDNAGILWSPVDAPLVILGDIARGRWPREFGRRRGTVLSYLMANYTPEGYRADQGGSFQFRYLIRPGAPFDPVQAHRLGEEALTPLEVQEITRNDRIGTGGGTLEPDRGSFLEVQPDPVALVTWKRAEEGRGTILRLVETGGAGATVRITSPLLRRGSLRRCTAVEDPLSPAHDRHLMPFGIGTFRAD